MSTCLQNRVRVHDHRHAQVSASSCSFDLGLECYGSSLLKHISSAGVFRVSDILAYKNPSAIRSTKGEKSGACSYEDS